MHWSGLSRFSVTLGVCLLNRIMAEHQITIEPCSFCGNTDATHFKEIAYKSEDNNPITYVECSCGVPRETLYTYKEPETVDFIASATDPKTTVAGDTEDKMPAVTRSAHPREKSHSYSGHKTGNAVVFTCTRRLSSNDLKVACHDDDDDDDDDDDNLKGRGLATKTENVKFYTPETSSDPHEAMYSPTNLFTNSDVETDRITESMDKIVEAVLQLPCTVCLGQNFIYIPDNEDGSGTGSILAKVCTVCDNVEGVDDSMSVFEVLAALQRQEYKVSQCLKCRNDDSDLFIFEEKDGELCLRCSVCNTLRYIEGSSGKKEAEEGSDWKKQSGQSDADIGNYSHSSGLSDIMSYLECECGNKRDFTIERDGCGMIEFILCLRCNVHFKPYFGIKGEDPSKKDSSYPSPRTRIRDLLELQMGDHIAWHRPGSYWHHGIVMKQVAINSNKVRVIHYSGDLFNMDGKVVQQWIMVDPKGEEVYRYDYNVKECLAPREVIGMAKSRLHENRYNLLTNNCEHFAHWCKTGEARSNQVKEFKKMCHRLGKTVVPYFYTAGKALMKSQKMASSVTNSEFNAMIVDIRKAAVQCSDGNISGQEFFKIVVKRSTRGMMATGGATLGEVAGAATGRAIATRIAGGAGSMVIPVPVVGQVVGCSLGYLIGAGLGSILGRQVVGAVDKKFQET